MDQRILRLLFLRGFVLAALLLTLAAASQGVVPQEARAPRGERKAASLPAKPARPPEPARFEVTVLDPAGQPVEGAFVVVMPASGAYTTFGRLRAEKVRSAYTNREGKAQLDRLPAGPWKVAVHARGLYARPIRREKAGALVIHLAQGGTITGIVREGEESRPIAGATVAVSQGAPLPGDWSGAATRNETTTDARGMFRLDGIGPSPVWLSARAPGYGEATRQNVSAGARVELFLFAGPTLSGTVRDDNGKPVKDAVVRAVTDGWGSQPASVRSDKRGGFVIAGISPGEYTVVAREGGHAPGIATVVVEPESEASVPLVLSAGGFATGRIVDAEGRPLKGSVRGETLDGNGLPTLASDLMAAESNPKGAFALGPLPLGRLGIRVSAPGHPAVVVDVSLAAAGDTVDVGDVALEGGLAIRGRVRDADGLGVAGASLRAAAQPPGGQAESETVSEADGAFTLGGLDAGRYQVTASLSGYATARAPAQAGGDPVVLKMEAGGQIAGRIVDADGQPVEDAHIRAQPAEGSNPFEGGAWGTPDEGDGRFTLRDLRPGSYVIVATARGRGEVSRGGVRVTAGGATDVGTLALRRGGVVVGTVVDWSGRGVPGAAVSAQTDEGRWTSDLTTQSDGNGAFELGGVPAGKVVVKASHPAFASGPGVVVDVDPEAEPEPVRLVMVQGGRIEGRALRRDGSPFVGGRVGVFPKERHGGSAQLAPVNVDGTFVVEHLSPGKAMVSLMAATSSSPLMIGSATNILSGVTSRDVEVRDGETVLVDFLLRDVVVAGRVTQGGEPLPGVTVSAMSLGGMAMMTWAGPAGARASDVPSGPPFLSAVTRADGSYELLVFAPGPARVDLRAEGQGLPTRNVEIPDVGRFELNFDLGETTISGVVVSRETGAPLTDASVGLRRVGGEDQWQGGARVGPDGRFTIPVDPGEYVLSASANGWAPASIPVSVGTYGVADLRVEMERGLQLLGRVVDEGGRPAPQMTVLTTSAERAHGPMAFTLGDGTFQLTGLEDKAYTLVTASELAGYAIRSGVSPGGDPVTLRLRPGGKIALRVIDAKGGPAEGATLSITAVGGIPVVGLPPRYVPTNRNGVTEISAPAGLVEVTVRKAGLVGRGTVAVSREQTVPLTVTLEPPKRED